MVNRVSCDSTLEGSSEQRITSDAVIEVNIEVSFAFRVFPVGAIEATGTQVLDQILRLMLPRFLSQLSKDYQAMGFRRHFKATSWDWRDLIVDQNGPYLAQRSLHLFQMCSCKMTTDEFEFSGIIFFDRMLFVPLFRNVNWSKPKPIICKSHKYLSMTRP
ncbi:unnamed protein product [Brassica rapa]|uniref:Uncharacterized protein n=1 Tax=Brassica campestris TaxID=3711 RepID=A0A3P5ZCZ8_BRACM|nr:unnamed protein product [Brassica rapa]VDC78326.1 unnamed protein product [Brassica rapa]